MNVRRHQSNVLNDAMCNAIGGSGDSGTRISKVQPWFMSGGWEWPQPGDGTAPRRVWPGEAPATSDRIVEQLMFSPLRRRPRRKVVVYNGLASWGDVPTGEEPFAHCPVSECLLSDRRLDAWDADAIIFRDFIPHTPFPRRPEQIWILYMLEPPVYGKRFSRHDVINWTATYRRDSDLVTPYERWVYYDDAEGAAYRGRQPPNVAANKTRKVAWFVSNCATVNDRMGYAKELQKHIQVDIYGMCGKLECPREDPRCPEMVDRDYKFYLSFENCNCRDYITEKLFVNGLWRQVLPVALGARPADYALSAPRGSYLLAEHFGSPEELARYLHFLDARDDQYNAYFAWKGTGEFINTHFFCRLCALLHDEYPTKWYPDINQWWNGPGTCAERLWTDG
ncbi:glycoprotein 3-alpha-L-fucosyltransferase A-like [Schistocerca gregaria]|uniref:glycoprotein 3-alpha-L-fucosyltransferase A-like n=1 Tax=Schistocerca gregaria TaxID=7010 RepID=UPI00211EB294|nr:glycoprotein 3-alpha-L-fucosyltransferase A-like [Schistocerca gregaria]